MCDNSARWLTGTSRTRVLLRFNSWEMFKNNVQLATIPLHLTRGGFHDIRIWSFGRFDHSAFSGCLSVVITTSDPFLISNCSLNWWCLSKNFLLLFFELKVILHALLELREVWPTWNKSCGNLGLLVTCWNPWVFASTENSLAACWPLSVLRISGISCFQQSNDIARCCWW